MDRKPDLFWLADYVKSPEARERARQLGLAQRRHGASQRKDPLHPTYNTWRSMKARCRNPNDKTYPLYGGRGVGYVPAWETFDGFLADMGPRPEGTTLDRIDGSQGYGPDNCRWATSSEQRRNSVHPSGYKHKSPRAPRPDREMACLHCGAIGTVNGQTTRYRCLDCKRAYMRGVMRERRARGL